MRILHCADLHLDSALNTHLTPALAEQRRNEILLRFQEMVRFAASHDIRIILIAGDLFDSDYVSQKTRHVVLSTISQNSQIEFLYLTGNHDELSALEQDEIPANMKLFTQKQKSYRYGHIVITGLTDNNQEDADQIIGYDLKLNDQDLNVVMMHGQITAQRFAGGKEGQSHEIYLSALTGKNIDYLALGHIHSYRQGRLDQRGVYAYSGCLEPRGFDETGEKGFIVLETSEHRIKTAFVPFAKRMAHVLPIDISGAETTPQVCDLIEENTGKIAHKDLLKVELTGAVSADIELNLSYISQRFMENFFAFRIEDQTTLAIDIDAIMKEDSMKGLFVRTVMAREEDDEVKRDIIRFGIRALSGEEIHT